MQIIFTIEPAKVQRIIDAYKGLYPIPLDENGDPIFTDGGWAKETIKRYIVRTVARYEQKIARDSIPYSIDDDIVSYT